MRWRRHPTIQDALDRARIVGREQEFLIGVRVLSGTISAAQAGARLRRSGRDADRDAVPAASSTSSMRQHGRMPGGAAAVIAMGKLGGREMTAASDLDLIIIYDFDGEAAQSDGAKSLLGQPILYALHAAADRSALGADR